MSKNNKLTCDTCVHFNVNDQGFFYCDRYHKEGKEVSVNFGQKACDDHIAIGSGRDI